MHLPRLLSGGERGIRTPGTLLGVHTISSRALSASQASLRVFYDKLAKSLTNPASVIPGLTCSLPRIPASARTGLIRGNPGITLWIPVPDRVEDRLCAGMTTFCEVVTFCKFLLVAERGGFEPPWELLAPKSISSRSRYDHFGTSPHGAFYIRSGARYNLFC